MLLNKRQIKRLLRYKPLRYLRAERITSTIWRNFRSMFTLIWYGRRKKYVLRYQGVEVIFLTEDSYSRNWFYPRLDRGRIHEEGLTHMLSRILKSSKCFVDIGANIGYFTCLASKLMPKGGKIHSFEMDELNYNTLSKNVSINHLGNVSIWHAAVTDFQGWASYRRRSRQELALSALSPESSKSDIEERQILVQTVALDDFFSDKDVSPDVIKIDVEGAEMKVLKGMQRLLGENEAKVFIEVHPYELHRFGSSAEDVICLLLDKAYTIYEIKPHSRKHSEGMNLRMLDRHSQLNYMTHVYAVRERV